MQQKYALPTSRQRAAAGLRCGQPWPLVLPHGMRALCAGQVRHGCCAPCQSGGKRLRKKKAAGAGNTRRRWATPSEFGYSNCAPAGMALPAGACCYPSMRRSNMAAITAAMTAAAMSRRKWRIGISSFRRACPLLPVAQAILTRKMMPLPARSPQCRLL